jgi:hypothetical protein
MLTVPKTLVLNCGQVWVKPNTEQSFLYGNHVAKAGLGRMTENTPKYQGVVVYNMNDVPLVREPQTPSARIRSTHFPLAMMIFDSPSYVQ